MNDIRAEIQPETSPFRILTVCTGNICRSPMAERLLQTGLDAHFPGEFIVESAGTGALVGNPIDARVAGFIEELGGNSENFAARQLSPGVLNTADLVLALAREHRSRVVEMSPVMLHKTFTLREFARLLPKLELDEALRGQDRWRAAIPRALRARSSNPRANGEDDVVDPYRRDDEIYARMAQQLAPAVAQLSQLSLDRTFGH
ncbi:arsenate reductase/protein-tyrosine-phosphatase family protein [Arthrobacter burdickii]|uniref:Low molecular weight phosphatase family protein n=1 Tax=Arthrobacter burdickii TaxID=3035920 RepID=A0ABT8K562_9MICC|nr:low molecular weight phosphatase family protein [Arthrobacter burdickii]MDN4612585.1 low molecular weight phosphatase family protein [Arthrobacter burdickii]